MRAIRGQVDGIEVLGDREYLRDIIARRLTNPKHLPFATLPQGNRYGRTLATTCGSARIPSVAVPSQAVKPLGSCSAASSGACRIRIFIFRDFSRRAFSSSMKLRISGSALTV